MLVLASCEKSPEVTFPRITADKRAHAALAEDVHSWAETAPDSSDRAKLAAARALATAQLRRSLRHEKRCDTLGLPDAATHESLFDAYWGGASRGISS